MHTYTEEINHHRSADGPGLSLHHIPPDPKGTPFLNLGFLMIAFSFTLTTVYDVYLHHNILYCFWSLKHCINRSILPFSLICILPLHTVFVKFTSIDTHCCHPLILLLYYIPLYGNTIWIHSLLDVEGAPSFCDEI